MRVTPSFAFAYVERAIQEGLGRRRFGKCEQAMVIEHFAAYNPEPSCTYCGNLNPMRWDHVIPVKFSGETVIGNMVLACSACDDSKQARPFQEWMRSRELDDCEERIERIERYMALHGYSMPERDSVLTIDEKVQLAQLREDAATLRLRLEQFLANVNARRLT